jgi:Flp pilus assembly protein TadG
VPLKKYRSDTAAVAVEFALVLPLLITIIFAITDFGRYFYADISITSASREGARVSSLNSIGASITDIQAIVYASAPNACKVASLSTCANVTVADVPVLKKCSTDSSDENTVVTVSTPFTWTLPIGKFFGGSSPAQSTLTSTGVMRCVG